MTVPWDQTDPDDEGQLSAADTLSDRGLVDALDEGYSPPERYRGVTAFGTTPAEALRGESLDRRLRQEVPDLAEDDDALTESGEFYDPDQVGDRRAGRLVSPDAGFGEDDETDAVGWDAGIDGGAASAEEAAVHVVEE